VVLVSIIFDYKRGFATKLQKFSIINVFLENIFY